MKVWYLIAIVCSAATWHYFPHLMGNLLFKANVLSLAAIGGFWIDRSLFPYARPDEDTIIPAWMYRRALIVSATMLAFSLAV